MVMCLMQHTPLYSIILSVHGQITPYYRTYLYDASPGDSPGYWGLSAHERCQCTEFVYL